MAFLLKNSSCWPPSRKPIGIAAVRSFGFESAIAFEPEPANFRLLGATLALNGLEAKVQTFDVAVSNRVGSAELKVRQTIGSKHRLLRGDELAPNTIRVPLTTLDALASDGSLDLAEVSLLWLDVEGHELEVLQGARNLLTRSVPIVMEFIPRTLRPNDRLEALHSLLRAHYTHVLDLRLRPAPVPEFRPLNALPQLAEQYRRSFTDLLVARLPNA